MKRLHGVEVIADDFMAVGYGQSEEEAVCNHDENLAAFLQRCAERGIRLNSTKPKLRQCKVSFIGHVADKGLRADPTNVRAIAEMPPPTDVAGVQKLLGMIQYLSKYFPHLSSITKPLRDLTQKGAVWTWDQPQQQALDDLQKAVVTTPVLCYYSLKDEVTLQCDASQHGLGARVIQEGQPVYLCI